MAFTNVSFYITKIKESASIGPFSADTDTSKNGRSFSAFIKKCLKYNYRFVQRN